MGNAVTGEAIAQVAQDKEPALHIIEETEVDQSSLQCEPEPAVQMMEQTREALQEMERVHTPETPAGMANKSIPQGMQGREPATQNMPGNPDVMHAVEPEAEVHMTADAQPAGGMALSQEPAAQPAPPAQTTEVAEEAEHALQTAWAMETQAEQNTSEGQIREESSFIPWPCKCLYRMLCRLYKKLKPILLQ